MQIVNSNSRPTSGWALAIHDTVNDFRTPQEPILDIDKE